jgi:hypothetical protein
MNQIKCSAVLSVGVYKHQGYCNGEMIEVMATDKNEARSILEARGYKVRFVTRFI